MNLLKAMTLFIVMYVVTLIVLTFEVGQFLLAAKIAIVTASAKTVAAAGHHRIWNWWEKKNDNAATTRQNKIE